MIEEDKKALDYLIAYKEGKIKQGLGINLPGFDKYFVLKKASFNVLLGLDKVGKT